MSHPPAEPPGLERQLARVLPRIALAGVVLPALVVLVRRWASTAGFAPAPEADLLMWDFAAWGLVATHLSLCVAVAVGCWVVRVMKGPTRVADSYPPDGRDDPLRPKKK
ncbi:MAG: hypothetical protein ACK5O3_15350 [Burkholderiales bacterium]|jgi:hypothetical protein